MGKSHDPEPDSVEAEKKKLVEALFPASVHRSQVNNLPLETITSIAELITTAFEMRERYGAQGVSDEIRQATNKTVSKENTKTARLDEMAQFHSTTEEKRKRPGGIDLDRYPGKGINNLCISHGGGSRGLQNIPLQMTVDDLLENVVDLLAIQRNAGGELSLKLGFKSLNTGKFLFVNG